MRLLLFLFLFAATCNVCLAFDWRTVKNTAVACSAAYSIVSWCLWHKQPNNDVTLTTPDHIIPFPPNVSLTDSACDESTTDTNTGDEEQPLFVHADEANVTTAASSNQSTAATGSLPSLQANGTNTTIVATPTTPTEQLTINNPSIFSQGRLPATSYSNTPRTKFSYTPSPLFISSCLAIAVLLALYQLFVYGSSFHDWLYSLVLSILAKAICFVIAAVDELPSGITEPTSSIVQVSRSFLSHIVQVSRSLLSHIVQVSISLLSCISKCFGFWSDRKNAISSETLLAFFQDLNHQTLGKKSIKSFRRKRCVSPWAKYKHAAEKFKAERDHWHAIFENGIADLHQQISDYTQLETLLKTKTAKCAKAKKSLSNRVVELEAQIAPAEAALQNFTDSFEHMQSLDGQVDTLVRESRNMEYQVRRAEKGIKALDDVQSHMETAPFTETLESVTKAGAEAERIIYKPKKAIACAGMAPQHPPAPAHALAPSAAALFAATPSVATPSAAAPSALAPSARAPSAATASPAKAPSAKAPSARAPFARAPFARAPFASASSVFAPPARASSALAPSARAPSARASSALAPSALAPSAPGPSALALSAPGPSALAPSGFAPSAKAPSTPTPSTRAPSALAPSTLADGARADGALVDGVGVDGALADGAQADGARADQILSTGARKIKKPVSRRKKLAPVDIAPVNEGDNSLPEYGGYNAFDEILAESSARGQSGGSTYDDPLLEGENYAAFDEFLARGYSYGQNEDST